MKFLRGIYFLLSTSNFVLNKTERFVEAECDIHVLNRGTARALTKVVDNRCHLHHVFVAEYLDAGVVRVVFDSRVKASVEQHRSGFVRLDLHEVAAFVMLGENFGQVFRAHLLGKHVREDGDSHGHALVVGAKYRVEERSVIKATDLLHFGKVLVGESESVRGGSHDALGFACLVAQVFFGFVFSNELLATAGVTGNAVGSEVCTLRKDACCNERVHTENKARGVAAGVCNALALGNGFTLCG